MKRFLLFLLTLPLLAAAQETTLEIPGILVREMHVFGGTNPGVELAVNAPLHAQVRVRADLWQLGDGLAAPLQKNISVNQEPLDFSEATRRLISWAAPVPKVKRVSRLALQFQTQQGELAWQPAGRLVFVVYPEELPEWQTLRQRVKPRFAVFGAAKPLRALLTARGLKYEDAGAELPEEMAEGTTYIGEATAMALRAWLESYPHPKGSLIVFCPDADALPVINVESHGNFCLTKISSSLLDQLLTDPRNQKAFADALNRTLDLAASVP